MKLNEITEWLSFDDVMLLPGYSRVFKDEINLSAKLTRNITLKIPLVSSPMDTVTEWELAGELASLGGLGIIHRNLSISQQVEMVEKVKRMGKKGGSAIDKRGRLLVGAAVGVGEDLFPRLGALVKVGVDVVCLDSAHGHAEYIVLATKKIKEKYPRLELISGNVGTEKGFFNLCEAGADGIRVGIGPGAICSTRIISGVGVPQISAIDDCEGVARKHGVSLIADGGIKQSGDITKALAAGGDVVMMGSMFAKLKEAPGKIVTVKGKKYKQYRGMGSVAAMKKGSASRYGQGKEDKKMVAEGVEGLVVYKGELKDNVFQLLGGLKSGMEYIGADSIEQMWEKADFVKITHAGLTESHPHSMIITEPGENYEI